MLTEERHWHRGLACTAIALIAGLLTWLCVGWFGHQPLLTAVVAVVLVEVFLASFGVIAMLLAERMTVSLLKSEQRPAPSPKVRRTSEPIWFRLPEPVAGSIPSAAAEKPLEPQTILFPAPVETPSTAEQSRRDRAA